MKRSEMIDKINLILEVQSNHGTSYRFKAIQLLEMIEKAGMLPPYKSECRQDVCVKQQHFWEVENET